ncbi:MAG TPA: DUF4126 domain-containing protein [Verrucomicrobiae bacterium]|nr:DUF4126 domain-containing protein [Verrucomicrobiae bacterium]
MEQIELLGAALGLGVLSGLSLYLTVFVVGISLHEGWLQLSPGLEPLQALDNPWIWGVALVLYLLEFFADKVPWVDSLWDSVHTAIRPIGAMLVAAATLGDALPAMEIIGVLCAGTAAVATHSAKAGFRLMVNTSPEPYSNIATSVAEDVVVVAGSIFVVQHPILALVITVLGVATFVYFAPAMFRALKAQFALIFGKLTAVGAGGDDALSPRLPHEADLALGAQLAPDEKIEWAVPCLTGRFPAAGRNVRGFLVRTSDAARLYFVGKKSFQPVVQAIPLGGAKIDFQRRFLCDEMTFFRQGQGLLACLRFFKKHEAQAEACHEELVVALAPKVDLPANMGGTPTGAGARAVPV